ncbi:CinA family protein [Nocardioides guangzhouensis]|uniref:CinA family protein n=1 Tax=Nocardioides guangzhouensis TaxID=2497878 RepID=A0A4Q4Z1F1_9ACTN|nr:CinA family protein [Nocardioides guangzhouensis]RYP81403.1 CinA family protein [Nocardioides guangzhouensis]
MTASVGDLVPLAATLLDHLRGSGHTIATAESLTGGLVGATLTAVPGSSDAYLGGVVSYATALKTRVLGVPEDVVAEHGVVSEECATAMAAGARSLTGADLGLATTGVAGPGPQDGVPAGTVWVAVSAVGWTATEVLSLSGDRDEVRQGACEAVLRLALNFQPSA